MSEAQLFEHVADSYDIGDQILAEMNLRVSARLDTEIFSHEPHWGRALEERTEQLPKTELRPYDFEFDDEVLADYDLSPSERAGLRETIQQIRENVRLGARDVFMVPDGEDGVQHMLAMPASVAEETKNIVSGTVNAFRITADSVEVSPKHIIVAGVAVGVLATGVFMSGRGTETVNASSPVPVLELSDIGFYRTADATVIDVGDMSGEIEEESLNDVARAIGQERDALRLEGSELILPAELPEEQAFAAYVAFMAPDTISPVVSEPTPPQSVEVAPEQPPVSPENMTDTEYISWLAEQAKPTAAEYATFDVDTTYKGAFDDELSGDQIKPTAFVGHWTAGTYTNGVEQFINAIKSREGNCCSVMYFMDKDSKVYRFTDSTEKTAHAKGANGFTQGVEIEAADLRGYTPEQMKTFIYLAYRFMTANDIPIERANFLGHEEVDAEYGSHGKIDMPPELVDQLFPKLQALAAEIAGTPVVDVPPTPEVVSNPQERYDTAINTFLDEIASHEGGWDSVNTGNAGDTHVGSANYNTIFGGRKLSDLTVQEVLDLQASGTIFAVGRYQMIDTTLRAGVEELNMDTSRKFNEDAQTELAINYLIYGSKRPELAAYLNGESDDIDAAMLATAKEWASFPCPDSYNDKKGLPHGTGYYDGDSAGNNAAGGPERVTKIRTQLQEIRDAKAGLTQVSAPPQPAEAKPVRTMTMIGDSLTYGYDQFGNIQDVDTDYGIEVNGVNAVVGRSLEAGADNGMKAIDAMQGEISEADIVYLGFGTNAAGSDNAYEKDLRTAVDEIADEDTIVVIPKLFSETPTRDARNEIIDRVAAEEGATVIDFSDEVKLGDDGLHPKNYKELTRRILTEVAASPYYSVPEPTVAPVQPSAPVATIAPEKIEVGNLSSILWFDEKTARAIYEAAYPDPTELDAVMSKLPTREQNGQIKYEVSMKNIRNGEN